MVHVEFDHIWMVVVGFLISFFLAFGIGANDVANSFGTSVGAKILTLRQACILGSIFEILGAVLLGGKVSSTIQTDIVDVSLYQNKTEILMVGNIAALSGSSVWMLGTTLLRIPISGTHTIVGALIGFALVTHGSSAVNWAQVGKIVGCWFLSPLISGALSVFVFYLCKHFILNKEDPLKPGLRLLPIFYASTIAINLFSVFFGGPKLLGFDRIPIWGVFILSCGGGIVSAVIVKFVIVPWQRRRILEQCKIDEESEDAFMLNNEEEIYKKLKSDEGMMKDTKVWRGEAPDDKLQTQTAALLGQSSDKTSNGFQSEIKSKKKKVPTATLR